MSTDSEPKRSRIARFETMIAALIGVLALFVSAYTANIQRQQVRAQVLPILKGGFTSTPNFRVILANKGAGPAIIRHVVVTVDGAPLSTWSAVIDRLIGAPPGEKHQFLYTTMTDDALTPGETISPLDFPLLEGSRLPAEDQAQLKQLASKVQAQSARLGFEICYCSTLDDCWTLTIPPGEDTPSTTAATSQCPKPYARTFKQ